MCRRQKQAWPLTLGLFLNAFALMLNGLVEELPHGLSHRIDCDRFDVMGNCGKPPLSGMICLHA